jgi:hypothetical protein
MGLGGYLAARTDQEHYESEERREFAEVDSLRDREVAEVETVFEQYGLTGDPLKAVVSALTSDRKRWVEFMMRFELGLERSDPSGPPSKLVCRLRPSVAWPQRRLITWLTCSEIKSPILE